MAGSRRVRKRSVSTTTALPTYVALLEPLQLDLQVSRDSNKFMLRVHRAPSSSSENSPTGSSWSNASPFRDYESLHKRLVLALQHGHFCNAGCPWLFSYLTSHFPKRSIFHRSSSAKTMETRRKQLLQFLTTTREFLLDRKNHSCSVAAADVAKPFAEFLYGDENVAQYIVESYEESSSQRKSSPHLETFSDHELPDPTVCGVCRGDLMCEPDVTQRGKAREDSAISASPTKRRSSVFATKLQCGHQFHDECIVPVLNRTLRCPTCRHLEIQQT